MELITGPLSVDIEFKVSLPHNLFATLILIESADRLEGMSDWGMRAAASLPGELAAGLHSLIGFLRYCPAAWGYLAAEVPDGHPAHTDFDAFIGLLRARPASSYRALALDALKRELARQGLHAPVSDKATDLRKAVTEYNARRAAERPDWTELEADPRAITALARDGATFKRELITLLETFWTQVYHDEFAACLPVMQNSVEALTRRAYPADFAARFLAITGRALPDTMRQAMAGIRRLVFVPSCHIGPYFVFAPTPPVMQVSFNCRTSSSGGVANGWVIELFPPLRALADETRLQILALLNSRELYAQEIIEALGISQSAASRHLQLLENTGLLSVRKENTAKYYSINPTKARQLTDALKELMIP
jgi:DNA-binding transcriptional ArsR family regulator